MYNGYDIHCKVHHFHSLISTLAQVTTSSVAFKKPCSSLAWATSVSAPGNRGVMVTLNGTGRLINEDKHTLSRCDCSAQFIVTTHTTRPSLTDSSTRGKTGLPLSSFPGSIFMAHKMQAISMNSELFATWRPTQIRLPKPYVTCPSSLVSTGAGASCPSSSRCLAGLNLSASAP
jgi:hypothetical protein